MEALKALEGTLTIYDAFLDLPHPASSPVVNEARLIIAPPSGEALESARAVGQELSTEKGLAMVARFCFPEFDDESYVKELSQTAKDPNLGASLNKYDIYLQDYYLSNSSNYKVKSRQHNPYCNTFGPSYHSFAMQLSSGDRVYGHVRRYFPHHPVARGRIDVGRRSLRAMVILTRANGGEKFYLALLKYLESVQSQKMTISAGLIQNEKPIEKILHLIHTEHTRLLKLHATERVQNSKSAIRSSILKIPSISLKNLEFRNSGFELVDEFKLCLPFTLVTAVESTQISSAPILPLLRCLGVAHMLRLFSALLCERRIILVSNSPSRLSACANAAASILAQGTVHWQHLYIPILPPGMKPYLAAPVPYLVGIIARHSKSLESVQGGVGQAVVVDLDTNDIKVHGVSNAEDFIPDLLLANVEIEQIDRVSSIAHILKEDLLIVLKSDRKVVGDIGSNGTAVKGKDFFLRGLGKLKRGIEKQRSDVLWNRDNDENSKEIEDEIYAFGEGVDNEAAEEEVKVAFTSFFVHLLGDMKCYLRPPESHSQLPEFDKDMFLSLRARQGDRRGTPMYALLKVFKDTQIFEQFVKARIQEVQSRKPITTSAPLFLRVSNYLRSHKIDFTALLDVRKVTKDLAESSPIHRFISQISEVRSKAMSLTSNSRNEQAASLEISHLAQRCREGTYLLAEVMSVVWERLRDSRGMQWKHALYALQIVSELILQGPMAAVVEATDGFNKIHKLKSYENMRPTVAQQIRDMAVIICDLLVNRVKLFFQRRVCASRRKDLVLQPPRLERNPSFTPLMRFQDAHVVACPEGSNVLSANLLDTDIAPKKNFRAANTYMNDLLEINFQPSSHEVMPNPSVGSVHEPLTLMENLSGLTTSINLVPHPVAIESKMVVAQSMASGGHKNQTSSSPEKVQSSHVGYGHPQVTMTSLTQQSSEQRNVIAGYSSANIPNPPLSPTYQTASPKHPPYQQNYAQLSRQQYEAQPQSGTASAAYLNSNTAIRQPPQQSQMKKERSQGISQFDPMS